DHWLAFREPGFCSVSALGEAADRGVVPDLYRWSGSTVKVALTSGVVGDRALCLFVRPPDVPSAAGTDPEWRATFELYVRTYGSDDALADRVVEHVRAWDTAGRPSKEGLRIRVFPKEAGYRPSDGELVVDKQWSRLVLDWPRGG
ncbi:MAG: hypothetical protein ACRDGN_05030, partial [bacterium]